MRKARGIRRRPAVATALLAAVIVAAPFKLDVEGTSASEFLLDSTAAAKDSDNSGSGGGGDDSDNSGSGGGGDDGGDDNSGSGGGDDGGDNDDGDNSGPGGGDDDGGGRGRGRGGDDRVGRDGERIEIRGGAIQVIYRGGWKEEIRNGRLELKDPRGRTVVRRRATPEDFARLQALAH